MEQKDSHWQRLLQSDLVYHFKRDKVAIASSTVFLILALMAVFSPLIAPFDPYDLQQIDLMDSEMPPVWIENADPRFLLGTDDQGRDLWSTILYGMRISLLIGVFAVLLQATIGIVIGLVSGYIGGRVDSILMRIADVQLSFSTLMVAIIVLAIVKNAFGADTYSSWAMVILLRFDTNHVQTHTTQLPVTDFCHRHPADCKRNYYRSRTVVSRAWYAGHRTEPGIADQYRERIPVLRLMVDHPDTRFFPGDNRDRD
jgi:ABC-type microcin C transport system permease subunit YejE